MAPPPPLASASASAMPPPMILQEPAAAVTTEAVTTTSSEMPLPPTSTASTTLTFLTHLFDPAQEVDLDPSFTTTVVTSSEDADRGDAADSDSLFPTLILQDNLNCTAFKNCSNGGDEGGEKPGEIDAEVYMVLVFTLCGLTVLVAAAMSTYRIAEAFFKARERRRRERRREVRQQQQRRPHPPPPGGRDRVEVLAAPESNPGARGGGGGRRTTSTSVEFLTHFFSSSLGHTYREGRSGGRDAPPPPYDSPPPYHVAISMIREMEDDDTPTSTLQRIRNAITPSSTLDRLRSAATPTLEGVRRTCATPPPPPRPRAETAAPAEEREISSAPPSAYPTLDRISATPSAVDLEPATPPSGTGLDEPDRAGGSKRTSSPLWKLRSKIWFL